MPDKKAIEKAVGLVSEARLILEGEKEDAQTAWDEKSEKWQESDAGQEAEEKINTLSGAVDNLEEVESQLEEFK